MLCAASSLPQDSSCVASRKITRGGARADAPLPLGIYVHAGDWPHSVRYPSRFTTDLRTFVPYIVALQSALSARGAMTTWRLTHVRVSGDWRHSTATKNQRNIRSG